MYFSPAIFFFFKEKNNRKKKTRKNTKAFWVRTLKESKNRKIKQVGLRLFINLFGLTKEGHS
jgi:hypothetical protein